MLQNRYTPKEEYEEEEEAVSLWKEESKPVRAQVVPVIEKGERVRCFPERKIGKASQPVSVFRESL